MPLESDFLGRFLQMWLEGLDRQVYEVAKLQFLSEEISTDSKYPGLKKGKNFC